MVEWGGVGPTFRLGGTYLGSWKAQLLRRDRIDTMYRAREFEACCNRLKDRDVIGYCTIARSLFLKR